MPVVLPETTLSPPREERMRRGRRLWPAAALVVAAKENDVGGIIAEAMLLLAMTRAVAGDGLRMLRPTISDVL